MRVALKGTNEDTAETPRQSTETENGWCLASGDLARKRRRGDTDSESSGRYVSGDDSSDSADGGVVGRQVTPTSLLPLLREEVEEAAHDAKTPYARFPGACRLCPVRIFDRRVQFWGQLEQDRDASNGPGCPSSSVMRLIIIALFSRDPKLRLLG